MKRRLLILFAVIAVFAMMSAGTLAYLSAERDTANILTTGNVNLKIHEKTSDGKDFPREGVVILPGDTVSKIVTVENTGSAPQYLRVKLTKAVNDVTLTADDCLSMNINTANWTEKDGYYYYHRPLQPGQITEVLFTEVYVSLINVDNDYMGKYFTLKVAAQAVQSQNNGDSVWDAAGWPDEEVAR